MDRTRRPWEWIVAVSIASVALYVASFAPVSLLFESGFLPEWMITPVGMFYAPLAWAGQLFPPFEAAMNWYLKMWAMLIL